jgi:hypothetical protein
MHNLGYGEASMYNPILTAMGFNVKLTNSNGVTTEDICRHFSSGSVPQSASNVTSVPMNHSSVPLSSTHMSYSSVSAPTYSAPRPTMTLTKNSHGLSFGDASTVLLLIPSECKYDFSNNNAFVSAFNGSNEMLFCHFNNTLVLVVKYGCHNDIDNVVTKYKPTFSIVCNTVVSPTSLFPTVNVFAPKSLHPVLTFISNAWQRGEYNSSELNLPHVTLEDSVKSSQLIINVSTSNIALASDYYPGLVMCIISNFNKLGLGSTISQTVLMFEVEQKTAELNFSNVRANLSLLNLKYGFTPKLTCNSYSCAGHSRNKTWLYCSVSNSNAIQVAYLWENKQLTDFTNVTVLPTMPTTDTLAFPEYY